MFVLLDYLHSVIKEVSEAEERNISNDETGAQAAGSTEDLDGDGVGGITFTARKASSKLIFLYRAFHMGRGHNIKLVKFEKRQITLQTKMAQ